MELKEFVTETLIAILEGVGAAAKRAEESKLLGVVAPFWTDEDTLTAQVGLACGDFVF